MAKITYDNKSYINQNADIPAANKVQDSDLNEIKTVVNTNDDTQNSISQDFGQASYEGAAIAGSSQFVNFDTFNSNGNLTPSASGITIGSGISAVLVSVAILVQNATNNYDLCYGGITKNGNSLYNMFTELRNSNGAQGTIVIPMTFVPVQQGDVIGAYANGNETTNIRKIFFNVKKIG
jgi:hypothetical protein